MDDVREFCKSRSCFRDTSSKRDLSGPTHSMTPKPKSFNAFSVSRTDEFSDLEIQCGKESWKAHKIVVCVRSSIFRTALTKEWKVCTVIFFFFPVILLAVCYSSFG